MPASVVSIGDDAFDECDSLTLVTIPAAVTNIGNFAFYSCTNLAGIYDEGDAPGLGSSALAGDSSATVYYLPGTAGWSPLYGGRPTISWNPQIQTGDANFGIQTNRFGFDIAGATNLLEVVQAATNIVNPVWLPIQTNMLTGGLFYFSDPQWSSFPTRYYRLQMP